MPTILITGATGSIGGAAALALARAGAEVVLAGRDTDRLGRLQQTIAAATGAKAHTLAVDLADMAAIRQAAAACAADHPRLDALIHTAALFTSERRLSADGLELMFAVNHLAPFLLTSLLLPQLRAAAPSRVLTVTAPATNRLNFADLQGTRRFQPLNAFGASKMANLLFTYELARRLDGSGVTANAVHPGLVRSELMSQAPLPIRWLVRLASAPPERAGAELADLALAPELTSVSGQLLRGRQAIASNRYSHDPAVQRQLWEASESLVG